MRAIDVQKVAVKKNGQTYQLGQLDLQGVNDDGSHAHLTQVKSPAEVIFELVEMINGWAEQHGVDVSEATADGVADTDSFQAVSGDMKQTK